MANTTNFGIITTANTFDQWRIRDNLMANDVNEIARGNFVKEVGNVTINTGTLTIANTSGGVILTVKDDARIDGTLSVENIESDGDGYVYLNASDIVLGNRAAGGLFQANINTKFDSANVIFSNSNIHFTSTDSNAVVLIRPNTTFQTNANVTGTLNVAANISNVGNLLVTQNSFTGNLSVTTLANITTANIATVNIGTLNVAATGATANIRLANIANAAIANIVAPEITSTTANITTVNATSFITVAGMNATDQANAARTQANNAYGTANGAANTVATFANGTLVLSSSNLNFNNTATVNVGITANGTTQTNAAFTVNANAITQLGTLTGLNVSGTANVTTIRSNDIRIDSNATYTILNGNGTFNNLDVKGNLVVIGSTVSDTDLFTLRAAASSDGDGIFRVKRGTTGKGNAEIRFLAGSDVWQATANANGSPTHYSILTTQNVTDSVVSTSTVNAAAPNSVKTSYDQATNARDQANTARTQANTARDQANTARTTANDAYGQANTATTNAGNAYGQANTATTNAGNAYGQANAAYNQANTGTTFATLAYGQANTARDVANASYGQANTATTNAGNAYNTANTAQTNALNAYGQANTARDQANTARTQANNAYGEANNRVSSVSGTSGRITSSGGLTPTIDLATAGAGAATYSSGISAVTVDAYGRVTSVTGSASYATTTQVGNAYNQANAAYNQANTAATSAGPAYDQANTARTQANNAYAAANNAVLKSGDTITGTLAITGSGTALNVTNRAQTASLGVGTAPSTTTGQIRATDDITSFFSSDIRLKSNVTVINDAVELTSQIRGVRFEWNDDYINKNGGEDGYFVRKNDIGVIAQEVLSILPEVVAERQDGTLAVKYDKLVALLIEAVKELDNRVKVLETK